jgi:protein-disulfide isomerase
VQQVAASLERTQGLTRLFGLIGTPAFIVGHTLVQGAISGACLRDLIAYERDEGYVRPVVQADNAALAD